MYSYLLFPVITVVSQNRVSGLRKQHTKFFKGGYNMVQRKHHFQKLAAVLGIFACCAAVLTAKQSVYAKDGVPESTYASEMRGMSAFQITKDMKAGWNLGNSLESDYNETYWGNPATTKAMIDAIAAKGFQTLRVPVRWDDNYSDSSSYTISKDYLDRVEEVANYGLSNGMYVILNVHHNDLQTKVSADWQEKQKIKDELKAIWTQIATRFKDYGDRLIFEVNNEPRSGEDWTGNSEFYKCVNECNETARAAIRDVGGKNSNRLVSLPTYCASPDEIKVLGWENLCPEDKMIAVSVHAYLPWDFAYEAEGHSDWRDSDRAELQPVFDRLDKFFISKQIPVYIGEFGATDKDNLSHRETYASVFAGMANSYGIPCVWWDNHVFGKGGEHFGIFDRNSLTFTGKIADNIVNAYKDSSGPNVLFSGQADASSWKQAVNVGTSRQSGSFDPALIVPESYFYVEYSGMEDAPELIFQSTCGGPSWAKVSASDTGSVNGRRYAKYPYQNCTAAFGTDFANQLDRIYVGAKESPITVYLLTYADDSVCMFHGETGSSNWEPAAWTETTKCGGWFPASCMSENGYFYVEYGGDYQKLALILQDLDRGDSGWISVPSFEDGYANGHYYVKFRYSDCVAAFGTDDFSAHLDKIYAAAKDGTITLYDMRYCYWK